MKHMRKPTIPVAPWDIPNPAGDAWDYAPEAEKIEREWAQVEREKAEKEAKKKVSKPVEKPVIHRPSTAQSTPVGALIGRTFMGALNVSDLHYMAMALLQTHDELCELRERIRILEAGKE